MARKLGGEKPHHYLQRTVLDPIGVHRLECRTDREGMPMLPGGARADGRRRRQPEALAPLQERRPRARE